MRAQRRANTPATRTSIQKKAISRGWSTRGRLKRRAAGFPDPVRPENGGKLTNDSLGQADILDDNGIVDRPIHRFRIHRQISLGWAGVWRSRGAVVGNVFMDLRASLRVGILSVELPPDLAFRIVGKSYNNIIGLVPCEKAEGSEGLQGGQRQFPQVPARPRAGVNVGAIFRLHDRHTTGSHNPSRRDGRKHAGFHPVQQRPWKGGKAGLEKGWQCQIQESGIQAEPRRLSSRRWFP